MEFKVTIILSHIANQSVEDMELNAQNYIKEFIEDDALIIESIEDITQSEKLASDWEKEGVYPTLAYPGSEDGDEMNYNIFQNCDITKEIATWRECLKMALKNNDTMYAMHCNEQITFLKQNKL